MRTAALLLALAAPAAAETVVPLPQLIEGGPPAAPFWHCAGFYEAIIARSSEAEFGAEGWRQLNAAYEDTILAAGLIFAETDPLHDGEDLGFAFSAAYQGAAIASGDYTARFIANHAARGEIIAGDAALETDLDICSRVRDLAAGQGTTE